ncbi:hypothetical protein [Legionella drancourtii]|uniref:Uncharacterized protein n=1 Tax=Legionella drancourtii LLAP12 TaxID=658187 RepID=G9ELC4_9GAMM|nr:hypothetical protein [Legionella drancourtii]EHL32013.1 hypothetical protein LDG_6187 [Legionella drancourtii LLAP12]
MLSAQQELQRIYMERLLTKALIEALSSKSPLNFDPQGRVLITVSNQEDRDLFFNATGREPAVNTTVSLDVTADSELKAEYLKHYGLTEEQFAQLEGCRGSIIPLQQEFHFHLGLTARTYTKMDKERFPEVKMNIAHEAAMTRVNELVTTAFKDALKNATKDGNIDDVKLVRALDKARKSISSEAHHIFLEEVVKATGNRLTKKEMKNLHVKHKAEVTTATNNDLLHVDQSLGQFTWIGGTDVTAHDRGQGIDHLANRQIMTVALAEGNQGMSRVQIRIPSLDVKEGIISDKAKAKGKEGITKAEAVSDVATKLAYLQSHYNMRDEISTNPVGKAFTYNLLTALNDRFEGGKNKQSQGARFILEGAHEYNASQLKNAKEIEPVFCLVQNISINGFGDSLGYGGNDLKTEATLMAEMAMLYNLVDKNDRQKATIEPVFAQYKAYLTSDRSEQPFFSQSEQGKEVIAQIQEIKAGWANTNQRENVRELDTVSKARGALKVMMANDLHQQHQYAKAFQALSIFVEQASIAGCKSGNERAQAIAGRVSVLDSVAHNPNDPIVKAMVDLAKAEPKDVAVKAAALKQQIDTKYDHNLQSGVSLISAADQGAAAKVNPKIGLAGLFNRNYAEESTMEHLHQGKAGKMQAHKGLTKQMADAAEGPKPMGFFAFLKAKLGTLGTVAMAVATVVAVAAAVAIPGLAPALIAVGVFAVGGAKILHDEYKKEEQAKFAQKMQMAERQHADTVVQSSHAQAQEQQAKKATATPEHGVKQDVTDVPQKVKEPVADFRKASPSSVAEVPLNSQQVVQHMASMKEVLSDIRKIGAEREQIIVKPDEDVHSHVVPH